ncbi:ABC transporter substrate-binding protein [Sporolituus thermophilus]|uniref:Amino acid/amide ABC transporter substrate-binding protein, HAAT family n=1 Tax=Sporolituus thermophilus DSM 23256 TaxID=1123285 RepID=A0A1G7L6Q4_9FIRM|nr:ABC transporter substrate-binding protein [Sporolituus thermophilus]SDF45158.1 amino acid/amide ABC transporter substrate-binding protein, HAAT family [Sporolituus thermophilus DSM 23256]
MSKYMKLLSLVVVLIFLVAAAGCGGSSGTSAGKGNLVIAMVNPLSGDSATYGVSHKNGIELAREEINKAGGIKGQQIEILFHDDAGDPKQAAAGAQKFADQKNVMAIVGSCLSSNTLAMVPITDKAKLPHSVVSSSTPKLSGISKYFFRMAVQDAQVGILMGDLIAKKLGAKKVAILYPNNDYGKGLTAAIEDTLKQHGVTVVSNQAYLATDKDYSALLTGIKAQGVDALAVAGTYTDGGLITKQARELGLTIPIVGGTGFYSPKFVEIAGKAAEGAIFLGAFVASNPDPAVQSFVKKYKEKYNMEPDTFAALGYDQMYVLAEAMKKAAEKGAITRENIRDAMAQTSYKGITGTVTFNDKGDWVRPYLYITVKDGKFVLYQ